MDNALLILDLDETLISGTATEPERPHDFRAGHYYVTKRPHLQPFLVAVFGWFDVAVARNVVRDSKTPRNHANGTRGGGSAR